MRLFFWNLARKSLADLIYAAIQLNDVDVAAFAEVDQLDFQRLAELLDDHYQTVETIDGKVKTSMLAKRTIRWQEASAVVNNLTCTLNLDDIPVNISVVHLPDKRNDPLGHHRERTI